MLIDKPGGGHVRLGDVAEVRVAPNEAVITHVDTSRHIDVVAQVDGRSISDISSDVSAGLAGLPFPLEYHAEVPAQYTQQENTLQLAWAVAAAALIGILVLLQTALGSWRIALVVFLALPLALAGGVVAALISGGIGSLVTLLGFVAIVGMAVRDSILLVRRAQTLEAVEADAAAGPPSAGTAEADEVRMRRGRRSPVLKAAQERLAPVLTAVIISAVFLVPLVVFGGGVGREIVLPLATVVWGGLVTYALLVLIVLPALLLVFGSGGRDEALKTQAVPGAVEPLERLEIS
ncbi:efflux RND transporter permease subunit [Arthrobacter sp. SA17]